MERDRSRVLLVGGESAAVQCLNRLQSRGDAQVVAVVPAAGAGNPLSKAASAAGLPVWPIASISGPDAATPIRSGRIDVLLNVHSLHLLPAAALQTPLVGAFNLHPGPLPEYAGLNPVSWAIFHGQRMHGVTVHAMTARTDAGPIAYQRRFPILADDTALTVSAKCVRLGLDLLDELIATAATGEPIPAHDQDLSRRRYFPAGAPDDARIDWSWRSAQVSNLVRACDYAPFPSPWGQAWTLAEMTRVEVLAVRTREGITGEPGTVVAHDEGSAVVASADGAVVVDRIRVNGERPPPRQVFGLGSRLNQLE